jgi:hypothetical protein
MGGIIMTGTAKGGTAGKVLTGVTTDELDRKIRARWREMQ